MTPGRWSDRPQGRALPPHWRTRIRPRILHRDPECTLRLPGCTLISGEVDHIDDPEDHSDTNLRGVCGECHTKRTQAQAAAARAAARARRPRQRPPEPHPGLVTTPRRSP